MDRRTKILMDEFNPATEDGRTWDADLQLAITLNLDVAKIKNAMDENGRRMCLDLLEYMAKNRVVCTHSSPSDGPIFKVNGHEFMTKEQLFENFL